MPRDQVSRGIFISCTLGRAAGAENRECLLPRIREGAEVMDFRVLQYFVTVAEELNFSRAAEKLNMSQPPLSNQIRQLEQDLGLRKSEVMDAELGIDPCLHAVFDLMDQKSDTRLFTHRFISFQVLYHIYCSMLHFIIGLKSCQYL